MTGTDLKLFSRHGLLRIVIWASLALLVLLSAASAIQGVRNAIQHSGDLQWHEGKLILHGINPYKPGLSVEAMENLVGPFDSAGSVQLPSVLLLFAPLAAFDLEQAKVVWALVNFIATIFVVFLLSTHLDHKPLSKSRLAILLVVFIAASPWRNTIGNGQHGLVAFALFLLSYNCFLKNRLEYSTIFLSLAMIKYTLILPFCIFFISDVRRGAIVIFGTLAAHMALTVVAGLLVQEDPLSLVSQSLLLAGNLKSSGWIDIFSVYHRIFPNTNNSFVPATLAAVLAFTTVIICLRGVDSRVASIVSIVSLILVYHRIYDAFVLIVLVIHLYAFFNFTGFAKVGQRQVPLDRWKSLEVVVGAGILLYAFFLDKVIYELHDLGFIVTDIVNDLDIAFAAAVYSYVVFLMARVILATSPRTA